MLFFKGVSFFEKVKGHMPEYSDVLRSIVFADAAFIFSKRNI